MDAWRETELKIGLPDESAWRWVESRLSVAAVASQHNFFFDTRERTLRGARIGLRLRQEGGTVRLTAKGPAAQSTDAAITRRIELERDSSDAELAAALSEGLDLSATVASWRANLPSDPRESAAVAQFLDALDAAGPRFDATGDFENERRTGRLDLIDAQGPCPITLELDRTRYPGGREDFEIEVEAAAGKEADLSRIRDALLAWLEGECGIRTFAAESKLARLEAILEAREPMR